MIIVEKVLKCSSYYGGYGGPKEIEELVADDVNNGYRIVNIEKVYYKSLDFPEINVIITLRKEELR